MMDRIRDCFNSCLKEGTFPRSWKKASLVVIPKVGEIQPGIPKVRPICLLSEVGKALERILANRLKEWMKDNENARLSENQYGFKDGRSTIDALKKVIKTVELAIQDSGVAIAVSLDIQNAFNSIPWRIIRKALVDKGFPDYLRRILDDYLHQREIIYTTKEGNVSREVLAGVPQGSVLGPILEHRL